MNISAYLPDELVAALDRVASAARSSRSAVMREAVELYLKRTQPGAWPEGVLSWQGDPAFVPFESLRAQEPPRVCDAFADAAVVDSAADP